MFSSFFAVKKTIRDLFSDYTIMTIAHCLNLIVNLTCFPPSLQFKKQFVIPSAIAQSWQSRIASTRSSTTTKSSSFNKAKSLNSILHKNSFKILNPFSTEWPKMRELSEWQIDIDVYSDKDNDNDNDINIDSDYNDYNE